MHRIRKHGRLALVLALSTLFLASSAAAQQPSRLDQVVDEIVARERAVLNQLAQYRPLVETYLQSVKPDPVAGSVPVRDRYFLARLDLSGYASDASAKKRRKSKEQVLDLYQYSVTSNPEGFARMLTLDAGGFDRGNYRFDFIRREFLGEVRTLIFEVSPRQVKGAKPGRFTGRIWVEDRDFNIVRFNGIYGSIFKTNLHFDSWRLNMAPGLWLPAYVYTEEADPPGGDAKLKHKGQTRIWGYDIEQRDSEEEFTKVMIDAPLTVDESERPGQISPVESLRAWEREAEDNVLRRLERAGLLAPEGEVSQVLGTVVANLEVTNSLEIYPPVRCRVLLTTPLESFTVGHTIVLSRGLIDVLPDEASLAMVLAHEMGHILGGHRLDTRYAFADQMLVDDKQAMEQFLFERDPAEEADADERAVGLLQNSPYKEDLTQAGLFLKMLAKRTDALSTLIRLHFGNRVSGRDKLPRLAPLLDAAPELEPSDLQQIAALPLGGRVKVDPWSGRVELMKNNRVALMSPNEKMPFQVTPLMPYVARYGATADAEAGDPQVARDRIAADDVGRPAESAVPDVRDHETLTGTVATERDENRTN